jgi:hypothetical protein
MQMGLTFQAVRQLPGRKGKKLYTKAGGCHLQARFPALEINAGQGC